MLKKASIYPKQQKGQADIYDCWTKVQCTKNSCNKIIFQQDLPVEGYNLVRYKTLEWITP